MKVTLINPRSKNPEEFQQKCFAPVDLMYLASSLLAEGLQAEIIDANALRLKDEAVVARIRQSRPQVIGVSLLSEILAPTYQLIRHVKDSYPEGRIVVGGPHANALPKMILREGREIDYVLSGESESSVVELCSALQDKTPPRNVKGLTYRKDGDIVSNGPVMPIKALDALKPPARHLLAEEYKKRLYYIVLVRERPVETLITSRGCPFRCRFCCNTAGEFCARSAESVLEEIVSRYKSGIRNFDIADANFTFDRERAMRIFDLIIKEKIRISFRIKSRTDSIDDELVKRAKRAGAYLLSLGMESGSQRILDAMTKGTKKEENVRACEAVLKAGLKLNTGWIIGFPGETPKTVEETVALITKIRPTTANLTVLVPYPGTDVYHRAKEDGTLVGDWSLTQRQIPWVKLPWIATYAELERVAQRARNKVYYRPYYVYNFSKEIIGNANITLARYALQESLKSIKK